MKWLTSLLLLLIVTFSHAQNIQNFELTNAVDGIPISLNNYSGNSAVVIIFIKQDCPYTEYYLPRIKTLAEYYSGKVPVLLINSTSENMKKMEQYANTNKVSTPYLADKEQLVFQLLNPHKSPEAFLLKNANGKFSVVYHGALDDNAQSEELVNHTYLQNAINNQLNGKKIEPSEIRPVGCSLQKN